MTEVKAKEGTFTNALGKAYEPKAEINQALNGGAPTKTRKPRTPATLSPADIVLQFGKQKLEDKLSIYKVLGQDIADEKKRLQEQLNLIGG